MGNFERITKELLPKTNFINFNYGVLDMGGQICLNRAPKCTICPIKKLCLYHSKFAKLSEN
jgi:A/G-specific adenine glycosylase